MKAESGNQKSEIRTPSGPTLQPGFPRVMWADYDADCKSTPVAVYSTKADQRGNRPGLRPVRVLVVPLLRDDQSAIAEAIDFLNHCAEQGHKLNDRRTK